MARSCPLLHGALLLGSLLTGAQVRAADEPRVSRSVILVLDRSGSMHRTDRQGLSAIAAQFVADHLGDRDRLVLLPFGSDVGTSAMIEGWEAGGRSRFRESIDRLGIGGDTDITGALERALEIAAEGDPSTTAIVLLTDGANDPPPSATRYHEPAEAYRKAGRKARMRLRAAAANRRLLSRVLPADGRGPGPAIFTVGFGEFDKQLLQVIAQRSGGGFFFARSSRDLPGTCDDILRILKESYRARSAALPSAGRQRIPLEVDPFIARASIRLIHPPDDTRSMLAVIRDPEGVVVYEAGKAATGEANAGIRHARGRIHDVVHLAAPKPGRWEIELTCGDYALDREHDRRLELLVERRRLSITSDLDHRGLFWPIWEPLPVRATLVDGDRPFRPGDRIEGWTVTVSSVEMRVDGPEAPGAGAVLPMEGPDGGSGFTTTFRAPPSETGLEFQIHAHLIASRDDGTEPIPFDLEKPPRRITFEEYPRGVIRLEPAHVVAGQRSIAKVWLEAGGTRLTGGEGGEPGLAAVPPPVLRIGIEAGSRPGGTGVDPAARDGETIALEDDGRGFDETAGDGIRSGVIGTGLAPGVHDLRLEAFHRGARYEAARAALQVHAPSSLAVDVPPSRFHPRPGHYLAGETVEVRARILQEGRPFGDTAVTIEGRLMPPDTGTSPGRAMTPLAGAPGTSGLRLELPREAGVVTFECAARGGAVAIPPSRSTFQVEDPALGIHVSTTEGLVGSPMELHASGGPWAGGLVRAVEVFRDGQPIDPATVRPGEHGRFTFVPPVPGVYRFVSKVTDLAGTPTVQSDPVRVRGRFAFRLGVRPTDPVAGVTVGEPVLVSMLTTGPLDTDGIPSAGESVETSDVADCLYRADAADEPRLEVDGPSGNFHFHAADLPDGRMVFAGFEMPGTHRVRIRPRDPSGLVGARDVVLDVRLPRLAVEAPGSTAVTTDVFDLGKLSFVGRSLETRVSLISEGFAADEILVDLREIRGAGGPVSAERIDFAPRSARRSLATTGEATWELPVSIRASPFLGWAQYEAHLAIRGRDRAYEGLPRGTERRVVLRFEGPYPLALHVLALLGLVMVGYVGRRVLETPFVLKGERYTLHEGFRIGTGPDCILSYPGLLVEHVIFVLEELELAVRTDGVAEGSMDDIPLDIRPRVLTDGAELVVGRGWFTVRRFVDSITGDETWLLEATRDFRASVPLKLVVLWWTAFLGTGAFVLFRTIGYLGA